MRTRSISVVRVVEAPFDATHFAGDLLDDPSWYKCTQVGVAGDHWWRMDGAGVWKFVGHNKPSWIEEIPPEES